MEETRLHRTDHLGEMDGLRGLLSLWVVVSHIFCWCGFWDALLRMNGVRRQLALDLLGAEPAVEVFIILSGFVISLLLIERRPTYRNFLLGRVFRIYPVYLTCLVLGLATAELTPRVCASVRWRGTVYFNLVSLASEAEQSNPTAHIFAHVTLLNGAIPRTILPQATMTLLPPGWSLSLEWQFYLLAPLVVWLMRSGPGLLFLGAASFLGNRYAEFFAGPHTASLTSRLPLFLVGILSYHAFARRDSIRISSSLLPAAIAAASVIALWHVATMLIWSVALAAILAADRTSADQGDLIGDIGRVARRLLRSPLIRRLGEISYPLYLVHWPMIVGFLYLQTRMFPEMTSGRATLALIGLGLPCMLGVAWAIHRFIEIPGMTRGKQVQAWVRNRTGVPASSIAERTIAAER